MKIKFVEPEVKLLAKTQTTWPDMAFGVIEYAGRTCYNSFKVGDNPNVTKIREGTEDYIENLLKQGHGSVLEHMNYTFRFSNVSRIFTHELVRHRAGCAYSQESGRYVRFEDEVPFTWLPLWEEQNLAKPEAAVLDEYNIQHRVKNWEDMDFTQKKEHTSYMRRFLPGGVATNIVATFNARALRHILELRTSPHAEEEMRYVFGSLVAPMVRFEPAFMDMEEYVNDEDPYPVIEFKYGAK